MTRYYTVIIYNDCKEFTTFRQLPENKNQATNDIKGKFSLWVFIV